MTTWVKPEGIMLSEISQMQKTNAALSHLCGTQNNQTHGSIESNGGCQGLKGGRNRERLALFVSLPLHG